MPMVNGLAKLSVMQQQGVPGAFAGDSGAHLLEQEAGGEGTGHSSR